MRMELNRIIKKVILKDEILFSAKEHFSNLKINLNRNYATENKNVIEQIGHLIFSEDLTIFYFNKQSNVGHKRFFSKHV